MNYYQAIAFFNKGLDAYNSRIVEHNLNQKVPSLVEAIQWFILSFSALKAINNKKTIQLSEKITKWIIICLVELSKYAHEENLDSSSIFGLERKIDSLEKLSCSDKVLLNYCYGSVLKKHAESTVSITDENISNRIKAAEAAINKFNLAKKDLILSGNNSLNVSHVYFQLALTYKLMRENIQAQEYLKLARESENNISAKFQDTFDNQKQFPPHVQAEYHFQLAAKYFNRFRYMQTKIHLEAAAKLNSKNEKYIKFLKLSNEIISDQEAVKKENSGYLNYFYESWKLISQFTIKVFHNISQQTEKTETENYQINCKL